MFITYVIKNSENKKIYIGYTSNLSERIARHNNILKNKAKSYTSKNAGKGTWNVVYSEEFLTRTEAIKREKELKSSRGRSFIREKIRP